MEAESFSEEVKWLVNGAGGLAGARPFLAPLYAVSARVGGSSYVELHLAEFAIEFFTDWVTGEPMKAEKCRR